jgi:hypothetical protein
MRYIIQLLVLAGFIFQLNTAYASALETYLEKLFGKIETRLQNASRLNDAATRPILIKRADPGTEFILATLGVMEASINAAEPNGIDEIGAADLDGDGIEELILIFNSGSECSTNKRCQIFIYKAVDQSKKKYRRIYSSTSLLTSAQEIVSVSRGVGKMRAIEGRTGGRVVDRLEP